MRHPPYRPAIRWWMEWNVKQTYANQKECDWNDRNIMRRRIKFLQLNSSIIIFVFIAVYDAVLALHSNYLTYLWMAFNIHTFPLNGDIFIWWRTLGLARAVVIAKNGICPDGWLDGMHGEQAFWPENNRLPLLCAERIEPVEGGKWRVILSRMARVTIRNMYDYFHLSRSH